MGHPEIEVSVDPRAGSGPDWLVAYFEDAVARGERFSAGETIQFGASILRFELTTGGDLELQEPKAGIIPMSWKSGIADAYRGLLIQRATVDALGLETDFPSYRDAAAVSDEALQRGNCLVLERKRQASTSAWSVSAGGRQERMGLKSLFEILSFRPEIEPFLALPAPARVVVDENGIEVTSCGRQATSTETALLRELHASFLGDALRS